MDSQEKVEYWLNLANYDLGTAKFLQRGRKYLYVCFMCQQVVEKALKAAITKINIFPPKTHDLIRLAELANLVDYMEQDQREFLVKLTPYNIEARYPSYKEEVGRSLNKRICKEYIIQTEEMFKWIQKKLRQ